MKSLFRLHYLFISLAHFLIFLSSCAHKQEKADLIVHNASINSMDEKNTIYQAMAIKDGKIIELGAERQIMNKYHADQYYDAKTKPVYPGFIDAHGHILNYGLSLIYVDLVGTNSFEEVLEKVKAYSALNNQNNIIVGRGWDQNDWENKKFPNNSELNKLFPNKPVILYRVDGHAALVNNKALEMAKINENSEISGGDFIKENNKLSGVLIDNAINSVTAVLPQADESTIEKALIQADHNLTAYGLTTVDDAGVDKAIIDKMIDLQKQGKMKLRVYAMVIGTWENLNYYSVEGVYKDDRMNIRSFKFLADGALGSRGACLKKPYDDIIESLHYGTMLHEHKYLQEAAQILFESGFQMNTHCIGDSAVKSLLQIYTQVLGDMNDKRWRIEHAQVVDPNDFDFFNQYSIIPSIQPTHATSDMEWAENRIGSNRMKGAYAYRTLLELNGWMPLGTDFPVENPDPLKTFYAAVFRKNSKAQPLNGFRIEEAISRIDALRGMTIWAAKSNFEEHEKGSLEVGKFADFVVLTNDLLKSSEEEILKTYVLATWINGEQVYSFE